VVSRRYKIKTEFRGLCLPHYRAFSEIWSKSLPSNNNRRQRARRAVRRRGSRRQQVPGRANGVISSQVPRSVRPTFKIRRAWVQQITYSPSTGFAGLGGNLSMYFSAGTSEVFINGTSVYTPTLPSSTEFSNLFDQWRINSVTLRCDWSVNSYQPGDVLAAAPLLYAAIDYDDNSNADVSALVQYPGCVNHSFMKDGYSPFVMTFKPLPLKDVAGVGITTAYSPDTSGSFLRTSNLSVPHYGVKIATSNMGSTSTSVTGVLQITAYVDMEFINPK